MKITVRTIRKDPVLREAVFDFGCDNLIAETGTIDNGECIDLAQELIFAAAELLPETKDTFKEILNTIGNAL